MQFKSWDALIYKRNAVKSQKDKQTYFAPYSLLLVFLFYGAKIKPELGTFEKQVLIVKWMETQ